LSLAHVGDSRVYLFRAGTLEQLTSDHSLVAEHVRRGVMTPQEAEASQLQNILVRALGTQEQVEVDVDEQILLEGDTLLLCSDGLTHMVTDPEIASTLATVEPAQAAAKRLVELANEYGGLDNVTVIVMRALPEPVSLVARLRGRPAALAEDCRIATVLVSREPVRRACPRPAAVIDRWSLWRDGAHAVFLSPEGVRVESARGASGDRPWVRRPEARTGQ